MRHLSDDERRARLGVRHLLADGTQATSYAEAAAAMVVLHATDPATVFLEGLGTDGRPLAGVDRARAVRGADGPAHARDAPHAVHRSAARCPDGPRRRLARRRRARAATDGEDADGRRVGSDPAAHLAELEEIALAAIREHGEVSTTELRGIDPGWPSG